MLFKVQGDGAVGGVSDKKRHLVGRGAGERESRQFELRAVQRRSFFPRQWMAQDKLAHAIPASASIQHDNRSVRGGDPAFGETPHDHQRHIRAVWMIGQRQGQTDGATGQERLGGQIDEGGA